MAVLVAVSGSDGSFGGSFKLLMAVLVAVSGC